MKNLLVYFIVVFVLSSCASAYKKAEDSFAAAEYESAIQLYKKQLPKAKNKGLIAFKIAEAYRLSNRVKMALPFYQQAAGAGFMNDNLKFYYAYALKANEQYEQARAQFELYLRDGGNDVFLRRARQEMEAIKQIEALRKEESFTKIKNCDGINSAAAEFSPAFAGDPKNKKLVFSSSRQNEKIYAGTGTGFNDLYLYEITDSANCQGNVQSSFFGPNVNLGGVHEASATFSADGNTMIFARSNAGSKNETRKDVDLYISQKQNSNETPWTEPQLLDRVSKGDTIWDATPALSPDGKTLYFASNRSDNSLGGIDIYKASKDANGIWGNVTNLGAPINTPGNDMFPYMDAKGRFFFSSDGHPSLGGLDLYMVDTTASKKLSIRSLGVPINSSADDFGIVFSNLTDGFFSSNRDGGKGDDDIYAFQNDSIYRKTVIYFLAGNTRSRSLKIGEAEKVLPQASVSLLDQQGKEIETVTSDDQGKFRFKTPITIGSNYSIAANKSLYLDATVLFPTAGRGVKDIAKLPKKENEVIFDTTLVLRENPLEEIKVPPVIGKPGPLTPMNPELELVILYEYDSARITPQAAQQLDEFAAFLQEYFKKFPDKKLELGSHTDSRGSDTYNQKLSERRAKSAVAYIVSKGIAADRIMAKGYGEKDPKIRNAKTEAQHQQNRRTTVRILKK